MMLVFAFVCVCVGLIALAFLFARPAGAVVLAAVTCFALAGVFQDAAGLPADPDGRLAAEEWRVLSIAPLADDNFIVSVMYQAGDVRTYRLLLTSEEAKDAFLKAGQSLKRGLRLNGKARRGRGGQLSDSDMGFSFSEAPELTKKGTQP